MTSDPHADGMWQQQPYQQGYSHPGDYQQPGQDQAGYGQQYAQPQYNAQPAAEQYAASQAYGQPTAEQYAAPQPSQAYTQATADPYAAQPSQAYGQSAPPYYGQTPYQQAPPVQPPYGGQNPGFYAPTGGSVPQAAAPGIGMVIAVTALFGLFGLIPASRRAKKAEALGLSGGKYWKTFGITLVSVMVLFFIVGRLGGGTDASTAASTETSTAAATTKPAATAAAAKPAATAKPANTAKPATTTQAAAKPAQAGGGYAKLTDRTWLQIVKNPEGHAGEKVVIYGLIYQFDNFTGTDAFMATAGPIKNESASDTNTLFVGDATTLGDFVQGDVFRAEAVVVGAFEYDTQAGGHTTAPKLQIVSIKKV